MIDIKKFEGHTAGPWYHENDFSFIESVDGEILATVRTTAPMHGRDARLIAAAPDLLAEVIRLRQRNRMCASMDEAEKLALVRCLQECAKALGMDGSASPVGLVAEVIRLRAEVAALKGGVA